MSVALVPVSVNPVNDKVPAAGGVLSMVLMLIVRVPELLVLNAASVAVALRASLPSPIAAMSAAVSV